MTQRAVSFNSSGSHIYRPAGYLSGGQPLGANHRIPRLPNDILATTVLPGSRWEWRTRKVAVFPDPSQHASTPARKRRWMSPGLGITDENRGATVVLLLKIL